MKKNMSGIDAGIRVLIAVVIGVLFYMGIIAGTLGMILSVVAVIFLLTSIINFCPLYAIFGISSCPIDKN